MGAKLAIFLLAMITAPATAAEPPAAVGAQVAGKPAPIRHAKANAHHRVPAKHQGCAMAAHGMDSMAHKMMPDGSPCMKPKADAEKPDGPEKSPADPSPPMRHGQG